MRFFIFLVLFAFFLVFIFWLLLRPRKVRPSKKSKPQTKKSSLKRKARAITSRPLDSRHYNRGNEQVKEITRQLLKKKPIVVKQAIQQWLREK